MQSLTNMPLWVAALLVVALPTAISTAGPPIIRRFINLDRLRTNNEVAGFQFAAVSVLYAVLLAFAVIVVWEKFNVAENDVAREASATATIFRLSDGLDAEYRASLREAMIAYLTVAIDKDWPAMAQGTASEDAIRALSNIYVTLLKSRSGERPDPIVITELLRQLDEVSAARRSRLVAAEGTVPGFIWLVLFGGAIVMVGFTFFFGAQNLLAQSLMTGALAALVFAGLLTVIIIDRPFTGGVKVEPEPLVHVLKDFGAPRP